MICPSTEANLGDGLADLPGWLASAAALSLGSDSHELRSWAGELRLLEEGQRLALRRRNVAAAPEQGQGATAARLFDRHLAGGAAAAGFSRWGLAPGPGRPAGAGHRRRRPGRRAAVAPAGRPIFATGAPALTEVGGRHSPGRRRPCPAALRARFVNAMAQLWPAQAKG